MPVWDEEPEQPEVVQVSQQFPTFDADKLSCAMDEVDSQETLVDETGSEIGSLEGVVESRYPGFEVSAEPGENVEDRPDIPVAEPLNVRDQMTDTATEFMIDTAKALAWQAVTAIAAAHGLSPLVMAVDYGRRALSVLAAMDSTSGIDLDVPLPLGPDDLMVSMRVEGDSNDTSWPVHWFVEPSDGPLLSAFEIGAADHDDTHSLSDGWPTATARQREAFENAEPGQAGERGEPVVHGDTAVYMLDLRFVADGWPGPGTANQLCRYARTLWNRDLSGNRGAAQVEQIVFCDPDHDVCVLVPVKVFTA